MSGTRVKSGRARRWLNTATHLAVDQVREQVLADGGHFERSPAYHIEVMHDVLSLARLLPDVQAADLMETTFTRMAKPGDQVLVGPYMVTVLDVSRRRIRRLRLEQAPSEEEGDPETVL